MLFLHHKVAVKTQFSFGFNNKGSFVVKAKIYHFIYEVSNWTFSQRSYNHLLFGNQFSIQELMHFKTQKKQYFLFADLDFKD